MKEYEKIIDESKYLPNGPIKAFTKESIKRLAEDFNISKEGQQTLAWWATWHPLFSIVWWSPAKVAEATGLYTTYTIQKYCKDGILDVDRSSLGEYMLTEKDIRALYARKRNK